MTSVHPTAIVSDEVELGDGVEIGAYCVVRGRVRLGAGVRLISQVSITGPGEIGAGTVVHPFASLGAPAQDRKLGPGDVTAGFEIGEQGIIREYASVHSATNDHTPTRIGDRVFMMCSSHVGHDARVGDDVTLVNGALLAGHVVVGDRANISGNAAVHQGCQIGRLAMISGGVVLSMDMLPFCTAILRNRLAGVNLVGMRRAGMPRDEIQAVRDAYRDLVRTGLARQDLIHELRVRGEGRFPALMEMAEFAERATRGLAPGLRTAKRDPIDMGAAD
jgi:UDP-N-acetylglucosamine acyltransferase